MGSPHTYDYLMKYILIGDSACGKSSILLRFTDHTFQYDHTFTIGIDFGTRVVEVQGRRVKLQLWDTAGQEAFVSVTRSYYTSCACAILVYDITCRHTFHRIRRWVERVCDHAPGIPLILVGNKVDLEQHRQVSTVEGRAMAESIGASFLETSARSGERIDTLFESATAAVLERVDAGEVVPTEFGSVRLPPSATILVGEEVEEASSGCCTLL